MSQSVQPDQSPGEVLTSTVHQAPLWLTKWRCTFPYPISLLPQRLESSLHAPFLIPSHYFHKGWNHPFMHLSLSHLTTSTKAGIIPSCTFLYPISLLPQRLESSLHAPFFILSHYFHKDWNHPFMHPLSHLTASTKAGIIPSYSTVMAHFVLSLT